METQGSLVETVPVGYRFHPTDEELVGHYLKHKLLGHDSIVHSVISEIDICMFEPWELPGFSKVKSDDPEWYFFSPLGLKHIKGNKCNRATKAGYWKITGINRNIKKRGTNNVIGKKKTLVFHKGRSPHCVKTNWVIHEYHPLTIPDDKRNFVLCRLIEKAEKKEETGTDELMHDEVEPSSLIATDYENQMTADEILNICKSPPEVNLESMFPEQSQAEIIDLVDQPPTLIELESYSPGSTEGSDDLSTEDITHAFVNDTNPSQLSRKVHCESNETDAKLLSAQDGNIVDTTTSICNEVTGSRENHITSKVTSSHDALYAAPPPVSSKKENMYDGATEQPISSGPLDGPNSIVGPEKVTTTNIYLMRNCPKGSLVGQGHIDVFKMSSTLTFRLGEGNWAYDNDTGFFVFLVRLKIEEAINVRLAPFTCVSGTTRTRDHMLKEHKPLPLVSASTGEGSLVATLDMEKHVLNYDENHDSLEANY
ncbi:hypothetical protein RIF29_16582 [Crotalaria pallida]|uniref:NAC domain-containing protein n=1 Tax=Crotalaria pallida TaxID=3830 RepID=A0AAN9FGU3_CROPI